MNSRYCMLPSNLNQLPHSNGAPKRVNGNKTSKTFFSKDVKELKKLSLLNLILETTIYPINRVQAGALKFGIKCILCQKVNVNDVYVRNTNVQTVNAIFAELEDVKNRPFVAKKLYTVPFLVVKKSDNTMIAVQGENRIAALQLYNAKYKNDRSLVEIIIDVVLEESQNVVIPEPVVDILIGLCVPRNLRSLRKWTFREIVNLLLSYSRIDRLIPMKFDDSMIVPCDQLVLKILEKQIGLPIAVPMIRRFLLLKPADLDFVKTFLIDNMPLLFYDSFFPIYQKAPRKLMNVMNFAVRNNLTHVMINEIMLKVKSDWDVLLANYFDRGLPSNWHCVEDVLNDFRPLQFKTTDKEMEMLLDFFCNEFNWKSAVRTIDTDKRRRFLISKFHEFLSKNAVQLGLPFLTRTCKFGNKCYVCYNRDAIFTGILNRNNNDEITSFVYAIFLSSESTCHTVLLNFRGFLKRRIPDLDTKFPRKLYENERICNGFDVGYGKEHSIMFMTLAKGGSCAFTFENIENDYGTIVHAAADSPFELSDKRIENPSTFQEIVDNLFLYFEANPLPENEDTMCDEGESSHNSCIEKENALEKKVQSGDKNSEKITNDTVVTDSILEYVDASSDFIQNVSSDKDKMSHAFSNEVPSCETLLCAEKIIDNESTVDSCIAKEKSTEKQVQNGIENSETTSEDTLITNPVLQFVNANSEAIPSFSSIENKTSDLFVNEGSFDETVLPADKIMGKESSVEKENCLEKDVQSENENCKTVSDNVVICGSAIDHVNSDLSPCVLSAEDKAVDFVSNKASLCETLVYANKSNGKENKEVQLVIEDIKPKRSCKRKSEFEKIEEINILPEGVKRLRKATKPFSF